MLPVFCLFTGNWKGCPLADILISATKVNDMTPEEVVSKLEDEGVKFTHDPFQAIYILPMGDMISGCFNYGSRSEDHRIIENLYDDGTDRYQPDFWEKVFEDTEAVMVIPENNQVTYPDWLMPTALQQALINELGYEFVPF